MLVRKLKNINAKQKTKVEKIGEWLKIAWRIYVIYRGRREKNVLTSAKRNFHHKYPHSKSDSLETWPEFVIWFLKKWDVPILSILSWPRWVWCMCFPKISLNLQNDRHTGNFHSILLPNGNLMNESPHSNPCQPLQCNTIPFFSEYKRV